MTHRCEDLSYDDPPAGSCRSLIETVLDRSDDLIQAQTTVDEELRGITHLGVDHVVTGQVLNALSGYPPDLGGALHHCNGMAESLQIAHQ